MTSVVKIGINGFGRLSRILLRTALGNPRIDVVAINDSTMNIEEMVYAFKYNSSYGPFRGDVHAEGDDKMIINRRSFHVFSIEDPSKIPWKDVDAHYVLETTGKFNTVEKASLHMKGGAVKVVISGESPDAPMFLTGFNAEEEYQHPDHDVVCIGPDALQAAVPLIKCMEEKYGIEEGMMTTIHCVTPSQNLVDGPSDKNWRGGRGAYQNIIPMPDNSAAKSIGRVFPDLEGKFSGIAFHVPTSIMSCIDLTLRLKKPAESFSEVRQFIRAAAKEPEMCGYFKYSEKKYVSSDNLHDWQSCIFDATASIMLNPQFVKLIAWFDNEYMYIQRLTDIMQHMSETEEKWIEEEGWKEDLIACKRELAEAAARSESPPLADVD